MTSKSTISIAALVFLIIFQLLLLLLTARVLLPLIPDSLFNIYGELLSLGLLAILGFIWGMVGMKIGTKIFPQKND
jgi:hypothetical protein